MDEPEFEVTDLVQGQSGIPPVRRLAIGRATPRRWRLALAAASVLVALAVLVSVWLPLHTGATTVHGSATPTGSIVLLPTPLPIVGRLGAPPQNCPAAPALDMLTASPFGGSNSPVQLTGRAPVWTLLGIFPEGIVELGPVSPAAYWPGVEIWWEIGPDRHPSVTVQAFALDSGQIAWWGEGNHTPTLPVLEMSPALDYPPSVTWTTYMTTLFITHAGCYELKVSWAGGGWYTIFAAGQTGPTASG